MNKNWIFAIVLAILVVVSVVQAVQLNTIKEDISTGAINLGSTTTTSSSSSGSTSSSAASLSSLPQQVGGC